VAFFAGALGEALGKLYCAKYFDESSKAKALAVVENVRTALESRLTEVDWMLSVRKQQELFFCTIFSNAMTSDRLPGPARVKHNRENGVAFVAGVDARCGA
jgi:hypothetical protein